MLQSSTGLCRIQRQSGHFRWLMAETDCVAAGWTLVEIETGAMYPIAICVNNDCSDSLDIWQYVLSRFFSSYHLSPAPQNVANLNVIMQLNSVIICSSLTSHLSTVWASSSTCRARPNF